MKVIVMKPFKDKYTLDIYQQGQEIEVTEERYEALTSTARGPYIRAVSQKEVQPRKGPQEPKKRKKSR